jgi:hypothetical protein
MRFKLPVQLLPHENGTPEIILLEKCNNDTDALAHARDNVITIC